MKYQCWWAIVKWYEFDLPIGMMLKHQCVTLPNYNSHTLWNYLEKKLRKAASALVLPIIIEAHLLKQ